MTNEKPAPFRVLARKYRPRSFDELAGQEALVRTLKNAIESGRIAQAYMLTGVRGVGKTTTARLIARALNYTGPDGKSGPTAGPTDDCDVCRAIAEDRHPDVLEMDAASHTGVDQMREILDGVRYAPSAARYKIYIIDEVHMLSKGAFNALLKTLEEPPPHVIFIFATTEIKKVPVTVLSRCQRFDLKRFDTATLKDYYAGICRKEGLTVEDEALALISRAADGSARDGLSLLDQAISRAGTNITGSDVRDMLGLADSHAVMDMLEQVLKGDCPAALALLSDLYRNGAEPLIVIQDMLECVHVLTRLKVARAQDGTPGADDMGPDARERARRLTAELTMPTLGRAWQILLKGLSEMVMAPDARSASEMLLIRLAYAADLPDPADLLKKLKTASPEGTIAPAGRSRETAGRTPEPVALKSIAGGGVVLSAAPAAVPAERAAVSIMALADLDQALRAQGHVRLASEVYQYVHLVTLEQGRLEIRPEPEARPGLAADIGRALQEITGARWFVTVSGKPGAPTLAQQDAEKNAGILAEAKTHPAVKAVLEAFPGTEISIKMQD